LPANASVPSGTPVALEDGAGGLNIYGREP
jgi:hypothetical protein